MKKYITLLWPILMLFACNKRELLDARSRTGLVIPSTLKDYQALLDNSSVMNATPYLGELSADNFFMSTIYWQGRTIVDQNTYTWQPDIYKGAINIKDWNEPYQQILFANTILEGLNKITPTLAQATLHRQLEGSALFFRANALHNLAVTFSPAYDQSTAATDLGLPLKRFSDINERVARASLKQTYEQITEDLTRSVPLLAGVDASTLRNRPTQRAAYGLLARVYLYMGNYPKAGAYADSALQQDATLINYNTLPLSNAFYLPFTRWNAETIFQSQLSGFAAVFIQFAGISNQLSIDTTLFRSYHNNDLRRTIFFYRQPNGFINVNGSYVGTQQTFTGLANDEIYLIRAESLARAGKLTEAMSDLNTLLRNRYRTNTYTNQTATSIADALSNILTERRKEMPLRGIRWSDLKRLNKEGAGITLTRVVNNQTFTLTPNSPLYALPIPPDAIELGGLVQNKRQ